MNKTLKWTLAVVITFALIAGVVAASMRPIIGYLMTPDYVFSPELAPAAPDYSKQVSWLTLPDMIDYADMLPEGLVDQQQDAPVDVFYIHPTAYYGNDNWNSNMAPEKGAAQIIDYMVAAHASIFNGCCKIYSPQFREANISTFLSDNYGPLELAYSDVKRAFEYFIDHQNQGRPFILLSHSQGTTHAMRLLEEYILPQGLIDKMVVAYVIGYELPMDKFSRGLHNIAVCESAEQTNCIISWAAYGETSAQDFTFDLVHWYPEGWESSKGKDTLCVNPLSWRTDNEMQTRDTHLGTVLSNPLSFFYENVLFDKNTGISPQYLQVHENFTRAQCKNGRLYIETQHDNSIAAGTNEDDQNYHAHDINLFYMNIRENVAKRIERFTANSN